MDSQLVKEIKSIIVNSIGGEVAADSMPDDFALAGNVLDSMAVTNLILALEEYFDISFDDEDLSVEHFESVASLTVLVERKLHT